MSQESYVFGIDLGTTYSCISYLKDGRPEVCQSIEGENTTPSVVRMMPEDGEPVAGRTAKDMAVIYPDYTLQFVKALIGHQPTLDYGSEKELTTTPEDVSAEVLKKLAKDASAYTNVEVHDVVITVPAYFGENERNSTKQAGIKAGLNVVDIVEEPTAAAFYYGCEKADQDEVICIFDLGGGTFDVTAMKIGDGGNSLQVLTTDGDHDLGGKKWDQELIDMVKEKFREETGYADEFDIDIEQELLLKCESAKKQLSSTNKVNIPVKVDRKNMASIEVTREEFDARTDYLLSSAIDYTREVFDRVEEKGEKITKILLVGGSTFMPQVKARVQEEFGIEPILNEPNEAVSKGACIYCAWKLLQTPVQPDGGTDDSETDVVTEVTENDDNTTTIQLESASGEKRTITLPSQLKEKVVKTVATKSFGIRVLINDEPKIYNLITKDTVLPCEYTETFATQSANQENIKLELFQSEFYEESYELEDGVNIGESVLEGLPANSPENTPVELTIKLNTSGMIEITGSCQGTPLIGKLERNYGEGVGTKEE